MKNSEKKTLSENEVSEFLISNPDFFIKNPQVLNSIEITHESGAAVSLIQKQVEILRSNYNSTTSNLLDLLNEAKINENIFDSAKKFILKLIEASSIEEIVLITEKTFIDEFGATKSKLLFFTEQSQNLPRGRVRSPSKATKILGKILKPNQIYLGLLKEKDLNFIFNDKVNLMSSLLVPLKTHSISALLAIGTNKPDKYDIDYDTLFLDLITDVISKLIDKHNF